MKKVVRTFRSAVIRRIALTVVIAASLGLQAAAHHSAAREYDNTRTVEAMGVITKVLFTNPHAFLYFEEIGAKGQKIEWLVEMGPSAHLTRTGWTPDRLQPGISIRVSGQPSRTPGAHAMCCAKITRPDGTPLLVQHIDQAPSTTRDQVRTKDSEQRTKDISNVEAYRDTAARP